MRFFLILAVLIMTILLGEYLFVSFEAATSQGLNKQEQRLTVDRGVNFWELSGKLKDAGIISSRLGFAWEVMKEGRTGSLVAGEYILSGKQSIPEIAEMLASGRTIEVTRAIRVTFPEGWTAQMMADRLTALGLPGEGFEKIAMDPAPDWRTRYDFLQGIPARASLEGFLFPDTYIFTPDATAEAIVSELLDNFGKKVSPDLRRDAQARGHTLYENLILASVIEEEGRIEEDRRMISDIFWKRLAVGQPLQSDATINYINGTTKDQSSLTDLATDSPYNTYKNPGLPPGPISNPGLVSIRAAIYPEDNPYYYFLTDPVTRETVFAKTFEEHKRNRVDHGL